MECHQRGRWWVAVVAHSGQTWLLTILVSCFECQEENDQALVEALREIQAKVPQSPTHFRRWVGVKWQSSYGIDESKKQEGKTMKWITRMIWHRDDNNMLREFI